MAGIQTVRAVQYFATCRAVLVIENRPQMIGSTLQGLLREKHHLHNYDSIRGCGPRDGRLPGVEITNQIKADMTRHVQNMLRPDERGAHFVRYSKYACTVSSLMLDTAVGWTPDTGPAAGTDHVDNFAAAQIEFERQLRQWEERALTTGPAINQRVTLEYDGKGPGRSLNDDLSIAFGMLLVHPGTWRQQFKRGRT